MKKKTQKLEPLIGIWWDDGVTLAALAHSPDVSSSGTDRRDSDLQHVKEWPRVAKQFGRSPDDGYETVQRGRVLFDTQTKSGIIYHGSATSKARLKLIAKEFQLTSWKAFGDSHYAFGDEIDQLFEDDD